MSFRKALKTRGGCVKVLQYMSKVQFLKGAMVDEDERGRETALKMELEGLAEVRPCKPLWTIMKPSILGASSKEVEQEAREAMTEAVHCVA